MLVALAVLAVSGIGAATSSAAEVEFLLVTNLGCDSGTFIVFCWENNENLKTLLELQGEEEFTILDPSPLTLLSTLGEESITIICELTDAYHLSSTGATELGGLILQLSPLEANYLLNFTLLFLGCLLIGTIGEKCKLPTEKETVPLVAEPRSETDLVFLPESGTLILGFPIEQRSKCPATLIKTAKVAGTQLCEFEEPTILEDATEHLLECDPNSGLSFAEQPAHFEFDAFIEPVHLNERWDITEIG